MVVPPWSVAQVRAAVLTVIPGGGESVPLKVGDPP
jgi:hypothetical protein